MKLKPAMYASVEHVIVTFGYGNRTNYDDLVKVITEHGISYVIDVRKKPRGWSAIWSELGLNKLCNSIGIKYVSKTALGNDSGKSNWLPPDQHQADEAIREVSNLLCNHNVLILCAEKDPQRCHRVAVSEQIQSVTGSELVHWM